MYSGTLVVKFRKNILSIFRADDKLKQDVLVKRRYHITWCHKAENYSMKLFSAVSRIRQPVFVSSSLHPNISRIVIFSNILNLLSFLYRNLSFSSAYINNTCWKWLYDKNCSKLTPKYLTALGKVALKHDNWYAANTYFLFL